MSKRDEALFTAHDALLFAFQKVTEAQITCKNEGYVDDAAELTNALDHTRQGIEWLKITRMTFGDEVEDVSSERAVTEDDILETICGADLFEGNSRAIAQSVYAMLKSKGVVK